MLIRGFSHYPHHGTGRNSFTACTKAVTWSLLHPHVQSHLRSWSSKKPALVLAFKPVGIKGKPQICWKDHWDQEPRPNLSSQSLASCKGTICYTWSQISSSERHRVGFTITTKGCWPSYQPSVWRNPSSWIGTVPFPSTAWKGEETSHVERAPKSGVYRVHNISHAWVCTLSLMVYHHRISQYLIVLLCIYCSFRPKRSCLSSPVVHQEKTKYFFLRY